MSHQAQASAAPVIPLFPAERVTRHLLVTDYGTASRTSHMVVSVTGQDGVSRVVERTRTMTLVEAEAALRLGAVAVWPR